MDLLLCSKCSMPSHMACYTDVSGGNLSLQVQCVVLLQNQTCYCQPCQKEKSKHSHQYGLVGATAFIFIMAIVPALLVVGSLSVILYWFQRHNRHKQLLPAHLPFSELELNAESEVMIQGTFG